MAPPPGVPKPSGPPLPVLMYALCLLPITAFAGYAVTYGQDEEALEKTLRSKYGKEINQVEGKREQMGNLYMAAIKNPGSNPEQEKRLQQVLYGGKGDVKRHYAIDQKYYGTEEGRTLQLQTQQEWQQAQEEERKKMKKLKKKLKKKKKKEAGEEGEASTDSESETEDTTTKKRKKKAAAAGAAFAAAVAAGKVGKVSAEEKAAQKLKSKEKSRKEEKKVSSVDLSQIATLTAVAGAAALVGFVVGGGSRRQ